MATIEELQAGQMLLMRKHQRRKRIRLVILCMFLIIIAAALFFISGHISTELEVTSYELETEKLNSDLKIAMLSDLHNNEFGEENQQLIDAIAEYRPDAIIMCGDMVIENVRDTSVILGLCEKLEEIADIYYVYGNHEGVLQYDEKGPKITLDEMLLERGVEVCYGGEFRIRNEEDLIELLSLSVKAKEYNGNPAYESLVESFTEEDAYKIIVSHYPDLFYQSLKEEDFDLGLAGHYHGGQVIIPKAGGLYHKDTGFFPEYYGGKYELNKAVLIVSRGLGNSSVIPRINNNPELVLIHIKAKNM